MDRTRPLVRDVLPDLAGELTALLLEEGELRLAAAVQALRLVDECDCGEGSCQSIRTAEQPPGRASGPGHRTVPLLADAGLLVLDVVDDRIVYVEVLDRPPMRRRPAGR
ncbi:hypothetical protein [Kitasatospora sp. DSM 101779]|uniref:hypothetical protein n=1 Tax=Kitasatospora sp. DSM 101779 TaxID=2853165 RepID=UPI0021D82672|nr:hypothetical protein [Kitasatospora sp. DSM 101779]MCU7820665.1 hypothetical protein [Kitasatospora sp. DSM 101779]